MISLSTFPSVKARPSPCRNSARWSALGHPRRFEHVRATSGLAPIADVIATPHQVKRPAINGHQFGLDGEDSRTLYAIGDKFGDGLYHAPRLSFQANVIAGISAQAS